MRPGQIVYKGKSDKGRNLLIRYLQDSDSPAMCEYINELSQERTFLRLQGEKIPLGEEEKYVQEKLQKILADSCVYLLVFSEQKLIGASSITMLDNIENHVGKFGLSVRRNYRSEGTGRILADVVLREAERKLQNLRIITLSVHGDNTRAISMYRKFGFVLYSVLPKGVFYRGKYIDTLDMYKVVKDF